MDGVRQHASVLAFGLNDAALLFQNNADRLQCVRRGIFTDGFAERLAQEASNVTAAAALLLDDLDLIADRFARLEKHGVTDMLAFHFRSPVGGGFGCGEVNCRRPLLPLEWLARRLPSQG